MPLKKRLSPLYYIYREMKEIVKFRKDGSIKSKTIIEAKQWGSLPSVREEVIVVEWFKPRQRRKLVFCTRIVK